MAAITGERYMKKTISTVAVVAISMAVSAAAAGVGQERIAELQRPGTATIEAPSVTITGCVARGLTNDSYTLVETKKSGTAASDASTPSEPLALSGTAVDISKHVGHSVEVTGTYASTDATIGTAGTEKPAAPAATEPAKKPAKPFTVKSLKMVSASCSTASD
jgi:hypothetical protein